MSRNWIAVVGVGFVFACAGGTEEQRSSGSATAEVDQAALSTCTTGFTRARQCTDSYIPALVALRVRLNVPAGIADREREMGRPALVQVAMEEWATDSTDESIAMVCEKMASAPAEHVKTYLAGADGCLQAGSCDAYVDCIMPLHEASFSAK